MTNVGGNFPLILIPVDLNFITGEIFLHSAATPPTHLTSIPTLCCMYNRIQYFQFIIFTFTLIINDSNNQNRLCVLFSPTRQERINLYLILFAPAQLCCLDSLLLRSLFDAVVHNWWYIPRNTISTKKFLNLFYR
jgi:hypothetical protein